MTGHHFRLCFSFMPSPLQSNHTPPLLSSWGQIGRFCRQLEYTDGLPSPGVFAAVHPRYTGCVQVDTASKGKGRFRRMERPSCIRPGHRLASTVRGSIEQSLLSGSRRRRPQVSHAGRRKTGIRLTDNHQPSRVARPCTRRKSAGSLPRVCGVFLQNLELRYSFSSVAPRVASDCAFHFLPVLGFDCIHRRQE